MNKANSNATQDRGKIRAGVRASFLTALTLILAPLAVKAAEPAVFSLESPSRTNLQSFPVQGVVQEVRLNGQVLVIRHDAIPGYMGAMTMPFKVKEPAAGKEWQRGDKISFQLHVAEAESWIDQITKIGTMPLPPAEVTGPAPAPNIQPRHPLMDVKFTNELGRPVTLGQFQGQALALTFFFTRCPLPEFCPRLSKNFENASEKLASMTDAPTNWHFISVTFDPEEDTPEVLKAYGETYRYNPAHWSFLTGPPDKILELAKVSGVELQRTGGLINHNFRTLIIDPTGHLQMTFPFGGDLSDMIVKEMLKAVGATNQSVTSK